MVLGVGTDIVETDRFERLIDKGKPGHIFTDREFSYIMKSTNKRVWLMKAAGIFAAKEAAAKAMSTGLVFFPSEIEVDHKDNGAPFIVLHGQALEIANNMGIKYIHISISDTDRYGAAFALAENYEK
jgi:holo-[acyl-carrier protein] synthase